MKGYQAYLPAAFIATEIELLEILQPPFPDYNNAPDTTITIQKYPFIVRFLLRPLQDVTTVYATANASTRSCLCYHSWAPIFKSS